MKDNKKSTMKPFKGLRSIQEVRTIIDKYTASVDQTESIDLDQSLTRVLAQEITANLDIPPFDRSAMDGYAVIAEDTYWAGQFKPVKLECIGTIHAGAVEDQIDLKKGRCIQIATGAVVPQGADAVVMVEDTERENDGVAVKFYKPVHPGQNISKKGEDIKKNSMILKNGTVLTTSKIGALAAVGTDNVKVYKKPCVAVIPTGNEVAELDKTLKTGQVYDINSYTIFNLVKENGGEPIKLGIVEDTYEALSSALKKADDYDIVIFSGGSSVGEKDLLVDIIEEQGEVLFHGVQIKPGKPTLFGRIGTKLVFGLPGYPAACLTIGYLLIGPMIRAISRLPPRLDQVVSAKLSRRVVSTLGRHQFLTVTIEKGTAIPVFKESGAITSIANAVGYIEIPENVDLVEKGDVVNVKLFGMSPI